MFAMVMPNLEWCFGFVLCLFVAALGLAIIWMVFDERINLSSLLSEANGQASMSRFQLLIFTFVIAVGLFALLEKNPNNVFPEIPNGVLTLLGISASTYAVGKGISYSQPELMLKTKVAKAGDGVDTTQAQDLVDKMQEHADTISQAAADTKEAAKEVGIHAAAVQQAAAESKAAVQQAAVHAADAKEAARKSTEAAAEVQDAVAGDDEPAAPTTTITQVTVEQKKE
jgi:hypothetical protein